MSVERIRNLSVTQEVSPHDKMMPSEASRDHYFYVGRNNLWTILNVLTLRAGYMVREEPVRTLLDFGCGYGRITRWLRAAFPDASIDVTDLDRQGVEWCVGRFDCQSIGEELPAGRYDLIWVGSVFTHLPEDAARPLLRRLLESLAPYGALALTTHGRARTAKMQGFDWANDKRPYLHLNLPRDRYEMLAADYEATGYGYVDYPQTPGYGICIADAAWYSRQALGSSDFIQILFQERSDNYQDVLAFMRFDLASDQWGPLW